MLAKDSYGIAEMLGAGYIWLGIYGGGLWEIPDGVPNRDKM